MHFQLAYHSYIERYPTKLLALYHALRDAMVEGRVVDCGTRLPSTRELAALYELSRGTVNQVYDMLASEGYVHCVIGRGTFTAYRNDRTESEADGSGRESVYPLSGWGKRFESAAQLEEAAPLQKPAVVDFDRFAPDLHAFPFEAWHRCLFAQVREVGGDAPSERVPPQGYEPLRAAISQMLRRSRGIVAGPEQIAVTGGSMQAIALLAQLLAGPDETAVAETPAYKGIRRAIAAAGGSCIDAPVDAQGIVPADWEAAALFVTPARQFPTGAVLSLERRQALLRWAETRNAVIVEDDYDSEFRHRGKSLEPLKVLDRGERVVYLGSFTKTMLPYVRIGYAVLPPGLVEPFRRAMELYAPQPVNLLEQRALAAFMHSGEYERHLRRMKRVYSRKFALLLQEVTTELSAWFDWVPSDAGLHVFGWWKGSAESYFECKRLSGELGVRWSEAQSEDALTGRRRMGVYLNFPHLSEEDIERGVLRIKQAGEAL
ncbi:PLP-dependent aminotransferase family protein [Paenibacillus filicis]|uniref:PLP-dependent aminotransferase family protein n=1 Tax=Paenibacillus gyeongsangnamensis TaxID=3388067 RepID=A0ABT4QJQ9_9BACL|nr:PLP-dependent aminotransferase family protein [Paenibacillus filicis]MCZ8517112.1 PLP-dependent aminotransferase family protein [Paenibacillus filicis]